MKTSFIRMLSILCAILLMTGLISAWACAEGVPATPTDLTSNEEGPVPAEETEQGETEDAVDSVEVIITKSIRLGESWQGVTRNTKLVVLKLDLDKAQTVHLTVEGRNVWANVRKADQADTDLRKVLTDSETGRAVITWDAEAGSYLITIGPEEPNIMAKAQAVVLDSQAYAEWEESLADAEPVEEPEEIPEGEPEEEPETEPEIPDDRSIRVDVTWDVPDPVIGDTAHFTAVLDGYEDLTYTIQWQYSPDRKTWYDIPNETSANMDVVVTEENNVVYWRILVFIEEEQE